MTIYSRLKTSLFQVWEHLLHSLRRSRAGVDDEQITRRSWATKVYNFKSLPQAFQPPVLEIIGEEQALPYTVLTPTFEGYLKRENEKLVFCLDNRLFVLEKDGQNVSVTHFEHKNIYRIEFGEILLKAWINICGIDDRGVYSNTSLRFNSVTDFLFDPFLEAVRRSDEPANPGDMQQEREKFSPLKARHIKFMNYARKSLLPGERVAQYTLQPEMETVGMTLFGMTLFRRNSVHDPYSDPNRLRDNLDPR